MSIARHMSIALVLFSFVGVIALPVDAQEAQVLGVVGVLPDDVLNVRSQPGSSSGIVGALPFDATGVMATGQSKAVAKTRWVEVSYSGVRGWVSGSYLAQVATSRNVTPEWTKRLGSASTPEGLALRFKGLLQETVAGDPNEPEMGAEGEARLVGVTKSGLRRAVVLLSGYHDDSVSGEQFVLTMREEGNTWIVDTVRASATCWRGVSGSLCL